MNSLSCSDGYNLKVFQQHTPPVCLRGLVSIERKLMYLPLRKLCALSLCTQGERQTCSLTGRMSALGSPDPSPHWWAKMKSFVFVCLFLSLILPMVMEYNCSTLCPASSTPLLSLRWAASTLTVGNPSQFDLRWRLALILTPFHNPLPFQVAAPAHFHALDLS